MSVELTLGTRARQRAFEHARRKVLEALERSPMTAGDLLSRTLRNTGYCLPTDRDELVERMVAAGEIVFDKRARCEDAIGVVTTRKAYRLSRGKCRACGCTDARGCDEGCAWVEPDLCSACVAQRPGERHE